MPRASLSMAAILGFSRLGALLMLISFFFSAWVVLAPNVEQPSLKAELEAWARQLDLPWGAYAVVSEGVVWEQGSFGKDAELKDVMERRVAVASLAKPLAAMTVLKLSLKGKVFLTTKVIEVLPAFDGDPEVTVGHLLAHRSQGEPGRGFFYSTRFGLLTEIVEAICKEPYPDVVYREILQPAGLPKIDTLKAFGGWQASLSDLIALARALDGSRLLPEFQKAEMWFADETGEAGFRFPYGLGWFVQHSGKTEWFWHFGQDPEAGALFIRVPDKDITFVIISPSENLNRPFRLFLGNLFDSGPACAFMRHYVFKTSDHKRLPAPGTDLGARETARLKGLSDSYPWGCELNARAMAALAAGDKKTASAMLHASIKHFASDLRFDRGNALFLAAVSQSADLLPVLEPHARALLQHNPDNLWAALHFSYLLQQAGRQGEAAEVLDNLIKAESNRHGGWAERFILAEAYYERALGLLGEDIEKKNGLMRKALELTPDPDRRKEIMAWLDGQQ